MAVMQLWLGRGARIISTWHALIHVWLSDTNEVNHQHVTKRCLNYVAPPGPGERHRGAITRAPTQPHGTKWLDRSIYRSMAQK